LLVFFLLQLNPVRVFNSDAKLPAGTLHSVYDVVGKLIVALSIAEDPLLFHKVDGLLNGESSESLLVTVDDLVRPYDLGSSEDLSLHLLRSHVQLETPFSHAFLIEKLLAHVLDSLDFLSRHDSSLSQSVTHATAFADIVGDTIDQAELWREEERVITSLNLEERLLGLADFHLVLRVEVVGDGSLFALILEGHCDRRIFKDDIADDVSSLVAPVGDDGMATVLKFDHLFPVVLVLGVPLQLVDLLKA